MSLKQFWHVVSNVRPVVWIALYLALVPLFAFFYWLLPNGDFRIPDGGAVDYGGWLYYSIVTITTLGFGDYTPAHLGAQWLTAVEVLCGLIIIGFFLNAVGSMKSEIDVETEREKQRRLHYADEREKLEKSIPLCLHQLNLFLAYCYAVTTPLAKRTSSPEYNPDFTEADMADMQKPSGLPIDTSEAPAVSRLMKCAGSTCLLLDSLQSRVDLTLWPPLLEDCFAFVANFQMLSPHDRFTAPDAELVHFIRTNAALARKIEDYLSEQAAPKSDKE